MMSGVTCPKCGLMQLAGPTCKSFGAPLGGPSRRPAPPRTQAPPRAAAAPLQAAAEGGPGGQLSFHGSGGALFRIHIVNMLLTIITLGVYYF